MKAKLQPVLISTIVICTFLISLLVEKIYERNTAIKSLNKRIEKLEAEIRSAGVYWDFRHGCVSLRDLRDIQNRKIKTIKYSPQYGKPCFALWGKVAKIRTEELKLAEYTYIKVLIGNDILNLTKTLPYSVDGLGNRTYKEISRQVSDPQYFAGKTYLFTFSPHAFIFCQQSGPRFTCDGNIEK